MSYEEIHRNNYSDTSRDDYKRNYTEDKQIDQNNLDGECCKQSAIFDYWVRLEKFAAAAVDELETNLAALKSKVELEVKGMTVEGINKSYKLDLVIGDKITDKIATNIRRQNHEIKSMISDLNQAKHDYKIAYAARLTFQMKKDMLDDLIKLHGQGYFSKVEGKEYHDKRTTSQRKKLQQTIGENRKGRVKRDA